jgi:xanthine dehydrogenase accessory factor
VRPGLSEHIAALRAARTPFVRAQVVLAEAPTSAKPGDEAVVTADGTIFGFIGGSCAEATVREQSLALLVSEPGQEGRALVVRITPVVEADAGPMSGPRPESGKRVVHNPCLSGGTIEVFLEAELPALLMAVAGRAPIAGAVRSLATAAGFDVRIFSSGKLPPDTAAVVVAVHGSAEEAGLLVRALEAGVPYVGLVASRRRGTAVVAALPVADDLKARVHTPAGFDIGARTPEEVALSILAEIVSLRPRPGPGPGPVASRPPMDAQSGLATDPVCGMPVPTSPDALHLVRDGIVHWFCGPGCRDAFVADPAAYARE